MPAPISDIDVVELEGGDELAIFQKMCMYCRKYEMVAMPLDAYLRWRNGELIQHAWPEATPEQREAAISGTHDACFDEMFAEPDDD